MSKYTRLDKKIELARKEMKMWVTRNPFHDDRSDINIFLRAVGRRHDFALCPHKVHHCIPVRQR